MRYSNAYMNRYVIITKLNACHFEYAQGSVPSHLRKTGIKVALIKRYILSNLTRRAWY